MMANAKRKTATSNARQEESQAVAEHSSSEAEVILREEDHARIIERPDGFYWQDDVTGKMYGPFPTLLAAMEDMQYQEETDYEEGESLQEAEAEIGISDWIDPDTGEPAIGSSPHLRDE